VRVRSGTAGAAACVSSRSRIHEDDLREIALRGYEGAASCRHPGVGTDGPQAFTVGEAFADRFSDLGTVIGRTAALGLGQDRHGRRWRSDPTIERAMLVKRGAQASRRY
jgi:hypothetical protein